ncbi:MAG: class II fructose-bisphosphate aldolase [Pseudomonadota bacterium]
MTIATLSDVLLPAMRDGYAVAGLVVLGWEDALGFAKAAEETRTPIILQAGPGCRAYTPLSILGPMFRHIAEQASVPVVCHVDHAYSIDECQAGIDHGFTSVMFDGSKLPIEENIERTAKIVELAKPAGVSVEGEVGFVGYANGAQSRGTSADEAALFDTQSGADAMAISIGNVHLQTHASSGGLDWDALRAVEAVTRLPLVLHGGSGIPTEERQILVRHSRISKINIGTELRLAAGNALRRSLDDQPEAFDRIALLEPTIESIAAAAAKAIRSIGPPASSA